VRAAPSLSADDCTQLLLTLRGLPALPPPPPPPHANASTNARPPQAPVQQGQPQQQAQAQAQPSVKQQKHQQLLVLHQRQKQEKQEKQKQEKQKQKQQNQHPQAQQTQQLARPLRCEPAASLLAALPAALRRTTRPIDADAASELLRALAHEVELDAAVAGAPPGTGGGAHASTSHLAVAHAHAALQAHVAAHANTPATPASSVPRPHLLGLTGLFLRYDCLRARYAWDPERDPAAGARGDLASGACCDVLGALAAERALRVLGSYRQGGGADGWVLDVLGDGLAQQLHS
jgi:hypothetical protein